MRKFFCLLALLPFCLNADVSSALRAEIQVQQGAGEVSSHNKFLPLFPVQLSVFVKNPSDKASPAGKIAIHYALPIPHQHEKEGVLFTTEEVPLPSIPAKGELQVAFKTPQPLPTIADFVRQDWPMRQYQAIFSTDSKDEIIGTLALTYSAYYYPVNAHD